MKEKYINSCIKIYVSYMVGNSNKNKISLDKKEKRKEKDNNLIFKSLFQNNHIMKKKQNVTYFT